MSYSGSGTEAPGSINSHDSYRVRFTQFKAEEKV